MNKDKVKVFISSPYSEGDQILNVKTQIITANKLLDLGFCPFVPLLAHFLHMDKPRDRESWLQYAFTWLESSDVVLRLPGNCPGCDEEEELAKQLSIPVFYDILNLRAHYRM